MMRGIRSLSICALIAFAAGSAFAQGTGAIEQFRAFLAQTQSARATFTQVVTDARGKVGPTAKGSFQFQRPGKFRWVYEKPAQIIVGDGKTIWFFDEDLNQVTVKPFDAAFTGTPAALLAGRREIEGAFTLTAAADSAGLAWVDALPKQQDGGLEKIRLGFAANGLRAMELFDGFGNRTRIDFSTLEANPKLDAKTFTLVPPKGADVVGP